MKYFLSAVLFLSLFSNTLIAQKITGLELLNKAINYHDPHGNWEQLQDSFQIKVTGPDERYSRRAFFIDNKNGGFAFSAFRKEGVQSCTLIGDSCLYRWNGSTEILDSLRKKYKMTKKRAGLFRNYYTYLYGLPMKLRDKGTIIHDKVTELTFYGKETLRLKATYKAEVGDDIWYFYFDKNNYSLIAYQFFHDESKNDGEYILLEEEKLVGGIRIPKVRKWYTNGDEKWLGTDNLD